LACGGGLKLLLDFLDEEASFKFQEDIGVINSYLFAEYMASFIDGFGSGNHMNLGDQTFMFGLMFGDIGNGLVLTVIGVILSKLQKDFLRIPASAVQKLGGIIIACGISSMCFGALFGEAFLLNPNGGGIAYYAASRISWGFIGSYVVNGLGGEMDWRFSFRRRNSRTPFAFSRAMDKILWVIDSSCIG
jgi:hypothetical protein